MTRTTAALPAKKDTRMRSWRNPDRLGRTRRLLIAAAIFHVVLTTSIYGLGRYAVLPGAFDTNGIAVSFASDGLKLSQEAAGLSELLRHGQIRDWLIAPSPFHLKLYSVCFALLGPWLGSTILSAEPLNALCYLAILVLVFHLGQEIFDGRVGLMAVTTVALWPSFLLHTTQLLKDPFFITGMLAFILVNLRLLSKSYTWPRALLTGAIGGLIAVFTWLARDSMGELLIAAAALSGAMFIVQQFHEKHFQAANAVGIALLIVLSVAVTRVIPKFQNPEVPPGFVVMTGPATSPPPIETSVSERSKAQSSNPWSRLLRRVGKMRQQFVIESPNSSSNIDSKVQLNSLTEILRYLPRAAMIGFFAPFPNMWFATGGQVGSAGRLLSGVETLAVYVVQGLAIVGLWAARGRRRNSVWLLWLIAATGMIALGLVVVNVGALYRLRYLFSILLIILASGGAAQTLEWISKKRSIHIRRTRFTGDRGRPRPPQATSSSR